MLEEFIRPPEFVLISTIMSIGPVRPNQCLQVTLFYYFRFLFVTRKNYGVEIRGNLHTNILLLHVFNAGMPLWPVCHYGQYAITASMPLRPVCHYGQYAITANMPLRPICHYGQYAITASMPLPPIRHYGQYAIMASTVNMPIWPVWPICQYGQYGQYLSCINPNTLLWHNSHGSIVPNR